MTRRSRRDVPRLLQFNQQLGQRRGIVVAFEHHWYRGEQLHGGTLKYPDRVADRVVMGVYAVTAKVGMPGQVKLANALRC